MGAMYKYADSKRDEVPEERDKQRFSDLTDVIFAIRKIYTPVEDFPEDFSEDCSEDSSEDKAPLL